MLLTTQAVLVVGGAAAGRQLRQWVRAAQAEQARLCAEVGGKGGQRLSSSFAARAGAGKERAKIAVDGLFWRRLSAIFKM